LFQVLKDFEYNFTAKNAKNLRKGRKEAFIEKLIVPIRKVRKALLETSFANFLFLNDSKEILVTFAKKLCALCG